MAWLYFECFFVANIEFRSLPLPFLVCEKYWKVRLAAWGKQVLEASSTLRGFQSSLQLSTTNNQHATPTSFLLEPC